MADIFVQFNTAVYDHHDTLVRHRTVIARRYVSGNLWLDIVSTIPYDLVVQAFNVVGSLKGLKALRVLKLLRLGRTLRLIAKAEQHMNVSLAYIRMIKFLTVLIVAFHFMACGLCAVYTFENADCSWVHYAVNTQRWDTAACQPLDDIPDASFVYMNAMMWAACHNGNQLVMQTQAEYVYAVITVTLLAILSAYVIGEFFGIIEVLGNRDKAFALAMDELNLFIRSHGIENDLAARLRGYFKLQNKTHSDALESWSGVLLSLPISLRSEVIHDLTKRSSVHHVVYFKHLPRAMLVRLAMHLRHQQFPAGEVLLQRGTIIEQASVMVPVAGIVEVHDQLRGDSGTFVLTGFTKLVLGEELLWPGERVASFDITTVTGAQFLVIDSDKLMALMASSPTEAALITTVGRHAWFRARIRRLARAVWRVREFERALVEHSEAACLPLPPSSLIELLFVAGWEGKLPEEYTDAQRHRAFLNLKHSASASAIMRAAADRRRRLAGLLGRATRRGHREHGGHGSPEGKQGPGGTSGSPSSPSFGAAKKAIAERSVRSLSAHGPETPSGIKPIPAYQPADLEGLLADAPPRGCHRITLRLLRDGLRHGIVPLPLALSAVRLAAPEVYWRFDGAARVIQRIFRSFALYRKLRKRVREMRSNREWSSRALSQQEQRTRSFRESAPSAVHSQNGAFAKGGSLTFLGVSLGESERHVDMAVKSFFGEVLPVVQPEPETPPPLRMAELFSVVSSRLRGVGSRPLGDLGGGRSIVFEKMDTPLAFRNNKMGEGEEGSEDGSEGWGALSDSHR